MKEMIACIFHWLNMVTKSASESIIKKSWNDWRGLRRKPQLLEASQQNAQTALLEAGATR